MASIFKFPGEGGYDVTVIRKQDVLDCIDANIIDKEVALDLITKLEIDATTIINSGHKASFPYLGSIGMTQAQKLKLQPEVKERIKAAKDMLDKESYIMFRKKLSRDIAAKATYDRYYEYYSSSVVRKQNKRFREIASVKGDAFARFYLYSLTHMCAVDNEVIYLQYGEQESDNR